MANPQVHAKKGAADDEFAVIWSVLANGHVLGRRLDGTEQRDLVTAIRQIARAGQRHMSSATVHIRKIIHDHHVHCSRSTGAGNGPTSLILNNLYPRQSAKFVSSCN
jgi:hypothetical protein